MKRALVLYWHGLGDLIQLTPHLRELHAQGYMVDLMCRNEAITSHLFDKCSYINKLIEVPNPWRSKFGFMGQAQSNLSNFEKLAKGYNWVGASCHISIPGDVNKIDTTSNELILPLGNKSLEVFIRPEIEAEAISFIKSNYPHGYIFVHTTIEFHSYHNWDASDWIEESLPPLPIIDTASEFYPKHPDINFSFVLAREAMHRVLSSSVFVHACDAMNAVMDVVNYGRPDRKVWPLNHDIVIKRRESGRWL